jgi:hypothetical protein
MPHDTGADAVFTITAFMNEIAAGANDSTIEIDGRNVKLATPGPRRSRQRVSA